MSRGPRDILADSHLYFDKVLYYLLTFHAHLRLRKMAPPSYVNYSSVIAFYVKKNLNLDRQEIHAGNQSRRLLLS